VKFLRLKKETRLRVVVSGGHLDFAALALSERGFFRDGVGLEPKHKTGGKLVAAILHATQCGFTQEF